MLGFDLNADLQSVLPRRKADSRTYLASVPAEIAALVQERERLRERGEYARADEIRYKLASAGYAVKDTAGSSLELPRRLDEAFTVLSTSSDPPPTTHPPHLF